MKKHPLLLFSVIVWLCATGFGYAQESRAVVLGRVSDATGAAAPGARVTARSLDTGVTTASVCNTEDGFQLNYLQPGPYRISVEAQGFKTTTRDGLDVRVGDRLALDFTLEVGAVSDTVNITGEAPLLDASSATTGRWSTRSIIPISDCKAPR